MPRADVLGEIRAELARRRLSNRALAAGTGLTEFQVSSRLNGHVPLSVTELQTIAEYLDLPVGTLFRESA